MKKTLRDSAQDRAIAARMSAAGHRRADIARALGVSRACVTQWLSPDLSRGHLNGECRAARMELVCALWMTGSDIGAIAALVGLGRGQVGLIVRGAQRDKELPSQQPATPAAKFTPAREHKLARSEEVAAMWKAGAKQVEIADALGLSAAAVCRRISLAIEAGVLQPRMQPRSRRKNGSN